MTSSTTIYAVLLPGHEDEYEAAGAEERATIHARHEEFTRLLAERGHVIVGGAQLTHSRTAKVVRANGSGTVVSDGPYAESVEQLSGFYLVQSDDLDDLLQICGSLTGADGAIEVRATVPQTGETS
jgi:hypothetical protein